MGSCDDAGMRGVRGSVSASLLLGASLALGACQSMPGLAGLVGETPTACPAALLSGDLVRTPDGSLGVLMDGGPMFRVEWTSYLVGARPLSLVDDNGLVVAVEGDRVGVGGGVVGNDPLVWTECGGLVPAA